MNDEHFDENMNFVFKKERGEIDAWLATMDEATMEKSIGEAADALKVIMKVYCFGSVVRFTFYSVQRKQELDNQVSKSVFTSLSETELKRSLLTIVQPDEETVTQALKRLGVHSSSRYGSVRSTSFQQYLFNQYLLFNR